MQDFDVTGGRQTPVKAAGVWEDCPSFLAFGVAIMTCLIVDLGTFRIKCGQCHCVFYRDMRAKTCRARCPACGRMNIWEWE